MNRARNLTREGARHGRSHRILSIVLGSTVTLSVLSGSSQAIPALEERPASASDETQPPAVVARLKVVIPDLSVFRLRATIPVPPRTFPRPDGSSPFLIRESGGATFATQTEIVSRYAAAQHGADVVEVLARVQRRPGQMPGSVAFYDVLSSPRVPDKFLLGPRVDQLVARDAAIQLRAADVFGNVYSADLLNDLRNSSSELRTLRNGEFVRQVRTHEWLMPDPNLPPGPPRGALPHLMGVHSYVTMHSSADFLLIDLRVHNAGSGNDRQDPRDDPLKVLHFDRLELRVPNGWTILSAYDDPFLGEISSHGVHTSRDLVTPLPNGTLHVMPWQAQFQRRIAISRPGSVESARAALREDGLAFVQPGISPTSGRELYSWWNRDTARYYPQKHRLPRLDAYLNNCPGDPTCCQSCCAPDSLFAQLESCVAAGTAGPPDAVVTGVLGWAHPWGIPDGQMAGGDEIHFYDGQLTAWLGSSKGYRFHQLGHRMWMCRQPFALYNADGSESASSDWIQYGPQGPYLPVWLFLYPFLELGDPFGALDSPTFQAEAVTELGVDPNYRQALFAFTPTDPGHLIRGTRRAKVLAWLGNDAMAKDDLRMAAELAMMSYSPLPQSANGQAILTGMLVARELVEAHPADGLSVSRDTGWLIDTVAAAYSLSEPGWRQRALSWCREITDLLHDGQTACTGVLNSFAHPDHFDGNYRTRQSISQAILDNAIWGMRASVFENVPGSEHQILTQVLSRSTGSMILDEFWNEESDCPWFQAATAPFDPDDGPSFCGWTPRDGREGTDTGQIWCTFAYGFQLTGDPQFLERAVRAAGGDLMGVLHEACAGAIENRAALLSLMQDLGWQ